MEFFEVVQKRRSVRKYTEKKVPEEVIEKSIRAGLIAPNSSNMQPWEFFWVRSDEMKKKIAEACLSQPAATTASDLIVCVARIDTWKRNQKLMLENFRRAKEAGGKIPQSAIDYYEKVIPAFYSIDPIGVTAVAKQIVLSTRGIFKPTPRGPVGRKEVFEVVVKTTALACENIMLSLVAQGYACCPMEGFDEKRLKNILRLGRNARVVMVIGAGEAHPQGLYGPQVRFDESYFVHKI
ncbi:MAG: nitroreductase family protein [Bacteriovoracia bacterium]